MVYLKNLPVWERLLRLALGLVTAACGLLGIGGPLGWGLVAVGVGIALTGALGFCPACALAGRRLDQHARQGGGQ